MTEKTFIKFKQVVKDIVKQLRRCNGLLRTAKQNNKAAKSNHIHGIKQKQHIREEMNNSKIFQKDPQSNSKLRILTKAASNHVLVNFQLYSEHLN